MEKRISMHLHKPHAASQPSRFSHTQTSCQSCICALGNACAAAVRDGAEGECCDVPADPVWPHYGLVISCEQGLLTGAATEYRGQITAYVDTSITDVRVVGGFGALLHIVGS